MSPGHNDVSLVAGIDHRFAEITSIDDLATRQRLIWRDIMYDQLARARMMMSETGIDIKDKRVLPNENVALDSLFSLITSSLSLHGSRVSRPFRLSWLSSCSDCNEPGTKEEVGSVTLSPVVHFKSKPTLTERLSACATGELCCHNAHCRSTEKFTKTILDFPDIFMVEISKESVLADLVTLDSVFVIEFHGERYGLRLESCITLKKKSILLADSNMMTILAMAQV